MKKKFHLLKIIAFTLVENSFKEQQMTRPASSDSSSSGLSPTSPSPVAQNSPSTPYHNYPATPVTQTLETPETTVSRAMVAPDAPRKPLRRRLFE